MDSNSLIFNRLASQTVTATGTITAGQPVTFAGDVAAAGASILGTAANDAAIGEDVEAIVMGLVQATADGAILSGDDIEVGSSGAYRTRTTGVKIGRALADAAGGDTFPLLVIAASDLEGVSSFNGRTGAVSPTSGDYSASQVTNAVDQTGSYANPGWISSLAAVKLTGTVPVANGGTNASTATSARANLNAMQNWVAFPATHSSPGNPGDFSYNPATGELAICYMLNSWVKYTGGTTSF